METFNRVRLGNGQAKLWELARLPEQPHWNLKEVSARPIAASCLQSPNAGMLTP